MGFLMFCIFATYALAFWFGFKLITDETENYDGETMIAVSITINKYRNLLVFII